MGSRKFKMTTIRRAAALAIMVGANITWAQNKDGESLRHEAVINAPPSEVWKALTTSEGLKSWMAPLVDIDLRVGGKMRSNYQADGKLGDENTIENTILSYEPERMFSIKATKPPANFPFAASIKDMWSVMHLEPVGADRTRLMICGMGFKDDAESTKMREFFDKGNAHTLEQLRKKFAGTATPAPADALKIVQRLAGGEWIFEDKSPSGGIFRGRSVIEFGPDKQSLVARGWLGDNSGMYYHGATQIWPDPATKTVRFQSIDENGALASGDIVASSEDTIIWDWNMITQDGRRARYRVNMVFSDTDHYEFVLHEIKADGTAPERVRVKYSRVAEAPEAYHKMKTKG